jgi:hypothetical protein
MVKTSWAVNAAPVLVAVPVSKSKEDKIIQELSEILLDYFLRTATKESPLIDSIEHSQTEKECANG